MFTVNLKEIEIEPRILEDKTFSNESRYDLESEVRVYIEEKYPNTYGNPLTLGRKINDAVRDQKGENFDDSVQRERKESDERFEQKELVRKGVVIEIDEKYAPQFTELESKKDAELESLYNEYEPKLRSFESSISEEYKKVEEERSLKEDEIRYKYMKQEEELREQRAQETEEKINKILNTTN